MPDGEEPVAEATLESLQADNYCREQSLVTRPFDRSAECLDSFPLSTDLTNEYLKQDDRRLPAQEEYLWMSCFGAHMAALFVALNELLPYVPATNQDFTPYLARARNHAEAIDKAFRFRLAFLRRLIEIKRVHARRRPLLLEWRLQLQVVGVGEDEARDAGVAAKVSTSDGVGRLSSELLELCEATFRRYEREGRAGRPSYLNLAPQTRTDATANPSSSYRLTARNLTVAAEYFANNSRTGGTLSVKRRTYVIDEPEAVAPWAASLRSRLHDAFGSDELGQRTLDLLSISLISAQTLKSYAGRLSQFAEFCHDSENISPLEATTATVVRYVAWIGERGHIAAKSLQPYLSAINTFFELHNLDPIAKDSLHLISARRGLILRQRRLDAAPLRVPLPADVAYRFVTKAELIVSASYPEYHHDFRALLASVVNFMFFARGLTGVSCRVRDVHVDAYNITLQVYREKGRAGRRGPDDLRVLLLPVSEHPRVARLLHHFLDHVHLRKGAASAANAIGVPLSHIRYQGGWATNSDAVLDYIDPNVLPSPGAWFFFGHIAPLRHFQVQQDSAAVAFPVPPS
eukprot:jgi/Tetstr1/431155/TSEL_020867.t1